MANSESSRVQNNLSFKKGGKQGTWKKGANSETMAEQSLAVFFTKLSQTLDQIQNPYIKPPDIPDNKKFDLYSQAYRGFAQNNISKTEGFSIEIKSDPKYDELTKRLIRKKREKDASRSN